MKEYGSVLLEYVDDKSKTFEGPHIMPADIKSDYLGQDSNPQYNVICVAWSGMLNWCPEKDENDSGALWYSAASMGLKTVENAKMPRINGTKIDFSLDVVPLEEIMWVLEPVRLCLPVTGAEYVQKDNSEAFQKKLKLAGYAVAQIKFLASLCKGRATNCIDKLETEFSYLMLVNMCTNPRLPAAIRAAVADFLLALYVDRYPQIPNCGAPDLPEELWIFEDVDSKTPK